MTSPLPITVLISGGGTTLRNLIDFQRRGSLDVDFRLVISSHPTAKGLQFAEEANIPTHVIERAKELAPEEFREAVFGPIHEAGSQLVVMGGFLKHVLIPADFENRVMNIHPALIPAFCGKGMYGQRVHQAVLDYGAKISGCTVHFVDNLYDHGPIILQRSVPVRDNDTPRTLAARVFREECRAYPEAIQRFALEKIAVQGRIVHFDTS